MKPLSLSWRPLSALILLSLAAPGLAARAAVPEIPPQYEPRRPAASDSLAELTPPAPSDPMWHYLQELRRYEDPQQIVRRNAEFRAAQRRYRIATRKWLGYCPLRPTVAPTRCMGSYAPVLLSYWETPAQPPNFSFPFPFYWAGAGYPFR